VRGSRRPGTLAAVTGLHPFAVVRCVHGREQLIRLYAGRDGTIIEVRYATDYADEGAWVLDVVDVRMPDCYWVILDDWVIENGGPPPRVACAHAVRDVDWDIIRTGRVQTL
jgi:hypothetical protein